jgi:SAM-dependent methyltransferase
MNNLPASTKEIWNQNLGSELAYWDEVISGRYKNKERVDLFRQRASGGYPFPTHLASYIASTGINRILDVGSGPHTTIGSKGLTATVEIVAIDPLADAYNTLLEKYGILPFIRTKKGEAETLNESEIGQFNLVYSRNALDHSYDPLTAIGRMISVLRTHGVVYIEGSVNEAVKQKYHGLHRWNFLPVDNGDLVIWGASEARSLQKSVGANYKVSAKGSTWYQVEIRKC